MNKKYSLPPFEVLLPTDRTPRFATLYAAVTYVVRLTEKISSQEERQMHRLRYTDEDGAVFLLRYEDVVELAESMEIIVDGTVQQGHDMDLETFRNYCFEVATAHKKVALVQGLANPPMSHWGKEGLRKYFEEKKLPKTADQ